MAYEVEQPIRKTAFKALITVAVALAASFAGGVWLRAPAIRGYARFESGWEQGGLDVVYLVAGARAQERRIEALLGYVREIDEAFTALPLKPELWIGNDFEPGRWSSEAGRNLSRAEWARIRVREELRGIVNPSAIRIVPGRSWGTDGEMAALAMALRRRPEPARAVVLVTCPSHARRVVTRLRAHAPENVLVCVFPAAESWSAWLPWVTIAECAKIARDALGLSSAPLISRQWYRRERASLQKSTAGVLAAAWIFVALALPLYAWLLYPLLLKQAVRLFAHERARNGGKPVEKSDPVSCRTLILIAAHNEEADIERRLLDLAGQDFPRDRLAVYVGVDGSTDKTAEVARAGAVRAAEAGLTVKVHDFGARRGKVATLKKLVDIVQREAPDTEFLVFTDANTRFEKNALRNLMLPFSDPRVGGVCGRLILENPAAHTDYRGVADDRATESLYWQWENKLKTLESRLDSCLGANGAIYALRTRLFPTVLADNTIVDDFVIGMKVREQGCRMLYRSEAVAREILPSSAAEWNRRVRIGAGDFQALAMCRRCLSPRFKWFAWMFFSHKVLRWITPHLLLAAWMLAVAGMLAGVHAAWMTAFNAALAVGAPIAALAGSAGRRRNAARYFVSMQAALLVGSIRWLRGGLRGDWARTPRSD